jgi:ribosomal protein S18 acetylase RimI-like enzyme
LVGDRLVFKTSEERPNRQPPAQTAWIGTSEDRLDREVPIQADRGSRPHSARLSGVSALAIVPVPEDRFEDLKPLWRALYDHQTGLSPHLRDREVPFERAWESRRGLEREWFRVEPQSFVLAAQDGGARYIGYAFVRVRSGEGFAASWSASRPLAELITLVVVPEVRGQGVGSKLLDAVEVRLRELQIEDMVIGVVSTNTEAIRLYERRGAVPFLTQFLHRVRVSDDATPATPAPIVRTDPDAGMPHSGP